MKSGLASVLKKWPEVIIDIVAKMADGFSTRCACYCVYSPQGSCSREEIFVDAAGVGEKHVVCSNENSLQKHELPFNHWKHRSQNYGLIFCHKVCWKRYRYDCERTMDEFEEYESD